MNFKSVAKLTILSVAIGALVSCGAFRHGNDTNSYGQSGSGSDPTSRAIAVQERETTIWDIFRNDDSDVTVKVNKYIWAASLEVLDFLPIESVDPFSGVIVTGYGTPPGGGKSYRATVLVRDPALDARSLHVAMQNRGGRAVSDSTVRAIEDAILARARQLRIRPGRF